MSDRRLPLPARASSLGLLAAAFLLLSGTASAAGPDWMSATAVDHAPIEGLSCASETFCVAVGSDIDIQDGGTLTSPTTDPDPDASLNGVSCGSTTFCGFVDEDGGAFTDKGGTFSAVSPLDTDALQSISCLAAGFCAATSHSGNVYTYSGSAWSPAHQLAPPGSVNDDLVSCATSSSCVALTFDGAGVTFYTYHGSGWSHGAPLAGDDGTPESLSCTSTTFCLLTDEGGDAITYDGSAWGAAQHIDDPVNDAHPQLFSSCSGKFCAAVDFGDNALTTADGSTWTAAKDIQEQSGLGGASAVSCASSTLCVAGDGLGSVSTYAVQVNTLTHPKLSGTAEVGQTLTTTHGDYNNPDVAFGEQLFRCEEPAPSDCLAVDGATGTSYKLTTDDEDQYLVEYEYPAIGFFMPDGPVLSNVSDLVAAAGSGTTTTTPPTSTSATTTPPPTSTATVTTPPPGAGAPITAPPTETGAAPPTDTGVAPPPVVTVVAPGLRGSASTNRSGTVTVTLVCTASVACTGTASLKSGSKTLGAKTYSIAAGASGKVAIKVSSATRKKLRKRHAKVKASLSLSPAGGAVATHSVTLKVAGKG